MKCVPHYDQEVIERLIAYCRSSKIFSLGYEYPEQKEIGFRLITQRDIYFVVYRKGFFWVHDDFAGGNVYLSTSEMLNILSDDNKKEIIFNLDLFK